MTAPIGYPEQFGVILQQRRDLRELRELRELPGKTELAQTGELGKNTPPADPIAPTFADQLSNFVGHIDEIQKGAQKQSEDFAVGKTNDIHNTMIDVEQAEISLRLLANVRNRVVDLYREVMRMGS